MKNFKIIIILFCAFFLFGNQMQAQKLVMENDMVSYDDQLRAAIKVTIAPEKDDVRKAWEDFLEDNYEDIKVKGNGFLSKKDVLSAKKIKIATVSDKQFDLFMEPVEGKGTQMKIFGSFGYDMHITPQDFPKEYRGLESLTLDFLEDFLTDFYKDQIEDTQELVNELKEKRNNLKEDLSDNKEEITELKEDNSKLKKELANKQEALDKASATLEKDRDNLDDLKTQLRNVDQVSKGVFTLKKGEVSHDEKSQTAVVVTMETEKDNVRDAWEDFLEKKYDTKVKGNDFMSKDDVMSSIEATLPTISDKKLDLFAKVIEKGDDSQLKVFGAFGYDLHITPEAFPKEYARLKNFTLEFVSSFLTEFYEDKMEDSEELVDELKDDKSDLQKKISKNESKITALNEDNEELNEVMTTKRAEMEKAAKKLEKKKTQQEKLNKKLEKGIEK